MGWSGMLLYVWLGVALIQIIVIVKIKKKKKKIN
jgi:hypothetical protein